jgi:hypothetical protein
VQRSACYGVDDEKGGCPCRGDEKILMKERADIAGRRAQLTSYCDVLEKALRQLQAIPSELEGQIGDFHGNFPGIGFRLGAPSIEPSRLNTLESAASLASRSLEMYNTLNISSSDL